MAIDVGRVVQAAIEAARQDPAPPSESKKLSLPVGRAVLLGAGLMTAGRLIAGPKVRELLGSVEQRITDSLSDHEDEEHEGEGDADFDEDYEDEPGGETDANFDEDHEERRPRSGTSRRSKTRSDA